jgi:hypothetical protein
MSAVFKLVAYATTLNAVFEASSRSAAFSHPPLRAGVAAEPR